MNGDARPVLGPLDPLEGDVHAVGRRERPGRDDVAARDRVADEVQRDTLAPRGALHALVMPLDAADAGLAAAGEDRHVIAARGRAGPERARDDRAGPAD